jgi:RNA polymerase sigma-70 factor (ECF subfamily)
MSPTLQDAILVQRAQAGDDAAFTQIYERYAPAIYRYIYGHVQDATVAEDLHAEVFARMFEGLPRYQERGWPISAWLYRIAHDRSIDTLRAQYRRQHISLEKWGGMCEGPEQSVGLQLDCEELHRSLDTLTTDQRQVIQLRFLAEMSIQEVAQRLGRTEGAVKALQHRGLQTLSRQLRAYS